MRNFCSEIIDEIVSPLLVIVKGPIHLNRNRFDARVRIPAAEMDGHQSHYRRLTRQKRRRVQTRPEPEDARRERHGAGERMPKPQSDGQITLPGPKEGPGALRMDRGQE